ncbi:MAG: hypothetical protein CMB56_001005 [Methanobacteriota archaeon]|nr:MAG: hypothetical protein CMB56_001005 [Euryarchaeota archaeon]|tara:strand:+ start:7515 stop:7835 length:321 start_codon:yes stop_codon:yes gene_type:complete
MNLELIEGVTNIFCGIAIFGFTVIATVSRSPKLEIILQQIISFSCIMASFLLFLLGVNGGKIWSSEKLIPPLIALNIIITIAARMNLRGKQVSQGMNPHKIRNMNK